MVLFTTILVALLVLALAAVITVLFGGFWVAVTFGDILVCGLIIYGLVKLFRRKRK